jgi:FdhD protein
METNRSIEIKEALVRLEQLPGVQPLRQQTLAAHAAAIYGSDLQLMTVAEDVGRHNALDKAIGKIFLARRLERAELLILSSRISYELVQKSARARIPIILAHSRPTALAVELAASLNMTLASLDDNDSGLYVFCGEQRLVG